MIKLESVKIKTMVDESPDLSTMGDYTDMADDWVICRHCGQYLKHAETYDRITDAVYEDMIDVGNDQYHTKNEAKWERLESIYNALNAAWQKLKKRRHDCYKSTREFNYFKPYAGGEKPGSKLFIFYGLGDFERAESYNNGQWHYMGMHAEAIVSYKLDHTPYPMAHNSRRLETLQSGGLWGIESDVDESHLREVAGEELADLKAHLEKFNVDLSQWEEKTKDLLEGDFLHG